LPRCVLARTQVIEEVQRVSIPLTSGRGPRYGIAAVYDPALGDLVVFGAATRTGTPTRQTWLWNGTRWIIGP